MRNHVLEIQQSKFILMGLFKFEYGGDEGGEGGETCLLNWKTSV